MKLSDTVTSTSRILVVCAAIVVVIAGMRAATDILAPLLMAGFISIVCSAPLFWLKRHGWSNLTALVVVMAAIGLTGAAIVGLIATSLNEFSSSLIHYRENLVETYDQLTAFLERWGYVIPLDGFRDQFDPNMLIQLLNYMLNGLSNLIGNGLIVFLAVLFILVEVSALPEKLRSSLANPDQSMPHFRTFIHKVVQYLALKAATSLLTAFCVAIVLWVLEIDYVILWAVFAFFLNFIPYIGSFLAGLPAVLLGLIDHGLGVALWASAGYIVINILIGNVIETRLMGEGLDLSSFVVFVSLIFWGWVLGPTGMLLSIPLTMLITIALESNPETRPIARLMRNTPRESRSE